MQRRYLSLSLRKNVDLSDLQLGSVLLLRPFVVGDTLTKLAGMFAVERLGQAGLKPIVRRVFDDHSHPCRRLEDSPMSAKKLEDSCKTKDLADTVLHGRATAFQQENPEK